MLIARPRVYKIFLKKRPLNTNKRYVKKRIYFSLRERYHLLKSCMYAFDPNPQLAPVHPKHLGVCSKGNTSFLRRSTKEPNLKLKRSMDSA